MERGLGRLFSKSDGVEIVIESFALKKLRIDPAIASSPFISTIVDVSGVLITFNMTMIVGNYLGL